MDSWINIFFDRSKVGPDLQWRRNFVNI